MLQINSKLIPVYGLFNDANNISDHTALNGMMEIWRRKKSLSRD